jgi:hypothetical protein
MYKGYHKIKNDFSDWIPNCILITHALLKALQPFSCDGVIHIIQYFSLLKCIIEDNAIKELGNMDTLLTNWINATQSVQLLSNCISSWILPLNFIQKETVSVPKYPHLLMVGL